MRSRCSREPRRGAPRYRGCFSVGVVEVLLELVFDNLLGTGISTSSTSFARTLIACLGALLGNLSFCNLLLDVFLQLVDGVELGSQLCELVVSCGQLTLLDSRELTLMVACSPACSPPESLVSKGCVLASGQAGQSLDRCRPSMVPEPIW